MDSHPSKRSGNHRLTCSIDTLADRRQPYRSLHIRFEAPQVEKEEAECGLMNAYLWGHDARLQSGKVAVVTERHFRSCPAESVRGQPRNVGRRRRQINTSTGRISSHLFSCRLFFLSLSSQHDRLPRCACFVPLRLAHHTHRDACEQPAFCPMSDQNM